MRQLKRRSLALLASLTMAIGLTFLIPGTASANHVYISKEILYSNGDLYIEFSVNGTVRGVSQFRPYGEGHDVCDVRPEGRGVRSELKYNYSYPDSAKVGADYSDPCWVTKNLSISEGTPVRIRGCVRDLGCSAPSEIYTRA